MSIYEVLPPLSRTRQLSPWHKALRAQRSAEDLDWSAPQRLTSGRLKDQPARALGR